MRSNVGQECFVCRSGRRVGSADGETDFALNYRNLMRLTDFIVARSDVETVDEGG